jgi:hypothetical protein
VVQTCIVHLIRNSLAFVAWKDRKAILPAIKAIYRAENADMALVRLEEFEDEWGKRYPAIGQAWRRAWEHVVPFFAFAPGVRKMIYTTDEMDKRFFMTTEMTIAEIAYVHSFVRLRRGPFFRPGHRSRSRRAQGRSRLAAFAATARLGLDRPEHGGMLACNGDCIPGWHLPSGGTILGGRGRPRGEAWRIGCKRHQAALFCPAELRRSRAGFGRRGFHCVTKRS